MCISQHTVVLHNNTENIWNFLNLCYFNFFKKHRVIPIFFNIILRPKCCIYTEENIIYFHIIYLQDATRKFGEAIHYSKDFFKTQPLEV